ncbi:hypothetical protein NQZ68_020686 [Dissostichus eleginoides]|nr:hypothetical protein NQZ68_020686 [Dissostichus eleginoides]
MWFDFYKQHSCLLNNWTSSVPAIFSYEEGGERAEGASLCRALGGGGSCMSAGNEGLLTKPYTPLHEDTPPPNT